MAYFVWIIKDHQKKIYLCLNNRCNSKKNKKTIISVAVVSITPPSIAGLNFNFFNIRDMEIDVAAAIKLIVLEKITIKRYRNL